VHKKIHKTNPSPNVTEADMIWANNEGNNFIHNH